MNLASLGKTLASSAIEGTKNTVMEAMRPPDPPARPAPPESLGAAILGQISAMQRPLGEDQELMVLVRANDETIRVAEIFVPNSLVLVFAGLDNPGNVTRVIVPVETAQGVCKIVRVAEGSKPMRVNILTPKPRP
jgi:hypothetical protein